MSLGCFGPDRTPPGGVGLNFLPLFLSPRCGLPFTSEHEKRDRVGKVRRSRRDGAAIPVMHLHRHWLPPVSPLRQPTDVSHAVSISTIGTAGIAAATFIVLGLALLTSLVDRRFAAEILNCRKRSCSEARRTWRKRRGSRIRGVGLAGGGKRRLACVEEWYRIYGFDPEKGMPGGRTAPARSSRGSSQVQRAIDRAIGDRVTQVEFRILLPDGTVKYIHTVGHPVLNASGDLAEFVVARRTSPTENGPRCCWPGRNGFSR